MAFNNLKIYKTKKVKTTNRQIKTDLPVPASIKILKDIIKFETSGMHGQMPIIWDKAYGYNVEDKWGNKWIDFSSTIFVANAGHGNKNIIKSIKKTLKKPLLHSYTYFSPERISYIKYLIKNTPNNFEKAFLLSGGTEATEVALKLMRLNGISKKKNKNVIICFKGNWHGRTLGAQFMSGNDKLKEWVGYHDPNIIHLPFPYPWLDIVNEDPSLYFKNSINKLLKLKKINPQNIAGFMIETFQGWGAIFYPNKYIKALNTFAKNNDALVCFDEMQAGFGRTGKLFGYMHYKIKPDIICCGKGTSSSLPLSLVLSSKRIMDIAGPGMLSSTHSANPLACVSGEENLKEIINKKLIEKSAKLGKLLHKILTNIKNKYSNKIKIEIHGIGLVAGVIFKSLENEPLGSLCSKICKKSLLNGLILVHTGRESIKIGPPLMISEKALREGLEIFDQSINESLK